MECRLYPIHKLSYLCVFFLPFHHYIQLQIVKLWMGGEGGSGTGHMLGGRQGRAHTCTCTHLCYSQRCRGRGRGRGSRRGTRHHHEMRRMTQSGGVRSSSSSSRGGDGGSMSHLPGRCELGPVSHALVQGTGVGCAADQ